MIYQNIKKYADKKGLSIRQVEQKADITLKSIKRKYLPDIHEFIDCYLLPRALEEKIVDTNAQMRIA